MSSSAGTTSSSSSATTPAAAATAIEFNDTNPNIEFVDYKDESQLEDVMNLVIQDLSEPYSIFTYRYFLHRFPELCIIAIDKETKEPIGCVVGKIDYEDTNMIMQDITAAGGEEQEGNPSQDSVEEQQYQQQDGQQNSDQRDNHHHPNEAATQQHTHYAVAEPNDGHRIPTGYIGMLAVKSTQRRQGIGKALVRRVLSRMKSQFQCTSVTLETEVSNTGALRLYQNTFGFIREELLVRYYLNWGDAYRLRLWFA